MFSFFRKIPPLPPLQKYPGKILVEKEGIQEFCNVESFEKLTETAFIPQIDFADAKIRSDIERRGAKFHKKGILTREQLWNGCYYRNEILSCFVPDIAIRWIDPQWGWGVFANRDFKKMEFIAIYSGKLRRWTKSDNKNSYCFSYVLAEGYPTPYTIDARDQGGIARYINHSSTAPNLTRAQDTFDHITQIVLYAKEPIPKGSQLCYDYGPEYWAKRRPPQELNAKC